MYKLISGLFLPDHGRWELIYSHGTGTYVYIENRSRIIGTESNRSENFFRWRQGGGGWGVGVGGGGWGGVGWGVGGGGGGGGWGGGGGGLNIKMSS